MRSMEDRPRKARRMPQHLLPTTVVGSYPQPDWLVNRELLSKSVPRVRMNIWRVPEAHLLGKRGWRASR